MKTDILTMAAALSDRDLQESHEKLRRLQRLLRREIPDGDPSVIFDRALTLLLETVEKARLGTMTTPRPGPAIRPRTDKVHKSTSRHIPRKVKRAAWQRDGVKPYAKQGAATVANISLRCRRHNQYEGELIFGVRDVSVTQERQWPGAGDPATMT